MLSIGGDKNNADRWVRKRVKSGQHEHQIGAEPRGMRPSNVVDAGWCVGKNDQEDWGEKLKAICYFLNFLLRKTKHILFFLAKMLFV
jgi:hypothetical protein